MGKIFKVIVDKEPVITGLRSEFIAKLLAKELNEKGREAKVGFDELNAPKPIKRTYWTKGSK